MEMALSYVLPIFRFLSIFLLAVAALFVMEGFRDFRKYPSLQGCKFKDLTMDDQPFSWARMLVLTSLFFVGFLLAWGITLWGAQSSHIHQMGAVHFGIWYLALTFAAGLVVTGFYHSLHLASATGYWLAWRILGPNPRNTQLEESTIPTFKKKPQIIPTAKACSGGAMVPKVLQSKNSTIFED